mgnify:CR=1 FL=1
MDLIKKTLSILSVFIFSIALALPSNAKVEGDTIILGAAVSLTGKYSTNGEHTKNGYNMAVDRICLLYTSPSPRDGLLSSMPSSA